MSVPTSMVQFRPRRTRRVAWAAAAAVLLASIALAAALGGPIVVGEVERPSEYFGPADRVAMVGLGLAGAAAFLLLARPLVVADADGVKVRNIIGSAELPWEVVRAVRFAHGAPWASLELQDDEVVGVHAVQAVDKAHAVAAMRALRALHAAHGRRPTDQ